MMEETEFTTERFKALEERVSELELQSYARPWPDSRIGLLRNAQKHDLKYMAAGLGVHATDLTEKELTRFARSYNRQLRLDDIHLRHQKEALLGAMIAKHQFGFTVVTDEGVEIGGELPSHAQVQGPVTIRGSWFGVGDDWYDVEPWVLGEWNTWIDVEKIHDAVHVVYGVQSLLEKPLIEAVQFTIDGTVKAVQQTRFTEKSGKLKIREFDSAYIFKEHSRVTVNVFLSKNAPDPLYHPPTHAIDYPRLYGVSFVPYETAIGTSSTTGPQEPLVDHT